MAVRAVASSFEVQRRKQLGYGAEFPGPENLRVAGEDLFHQSAARARHADNEYGHIRIRAPTPDLLKKQTSLTGGVKGISLPPVSSPAAWRMTSTTFSRSSRPIST